MKLKKTILIIILTLLVIFGIIISIIYFNNKRDNSSFDDSFWILEKTIKYVDGNAVYATNIDNIKLYFNNTTLKICYFRNNNEDCELVKYTNNDNNYTFKDVNAISTLDNSYGFIDNERFFIRKKIDSGVIDYVFVNYDMNKQKKAQINNLNYEQLYLIEEYDENGNFTDTIHDSSMRIDINDSVMKICIIPAENFCEEVYYSKSGTKYNIISREKLIFDGDIEISEQVDEHQQISIIITYFMSNNKKRKLYFS